LIFLCIQPHQLDLLVKEIYQPLNERLEKLRKKKIKIFPTIISMLSGITLDKLKTLFPEDVNLIKTSINPEILSLYDEIYNLKNFQSNEELKKKLKTIKQIKDIKQYNKFNNNSINENNNHNDHNSQLNFNRSECILNILFLSINKIKLINIFFYFKIPF